jgi:hypothetical protein
VWGLDVILAAAEMRKHHLFILLESKSIVYFGQSHDDIYIYEMLRERWGRKNESEHET